MQYSSHIKLKCRNFAMWVVICFLLINIGDIIRTDNLALLSGTLRTFEQVGCNDNIVTLKCPAGTSISVELAQYGKASPSKKACPQENANLKASGLRKTNISCSLPSSLQNKWDELTRGTWGRTVVEACQKKRNCKFQAAPKSFEGDPCLSERKYVEVAYKCRPYEFRSRVVCENERVQLQCNPNSRVAIYSASYGRTEYESFQCPQPQGVAEETCLVKYATETVMKLCHGYRSCGFSANASIFGNPCRPGTRMYLRIVYTCVPKRVLSPQYEGPLLEDETEADVNYNYDQDDFDLNYDSNNEHIREAAALPPSSNKNGTKPKPSMKTSVLPDFFPRAKSQSPFEDDIGDLDWYWIFSIICAVLLCTLLLASAILVRRYRSGRNDKLQIAVSNESNHETPNCFIDDVSDGEADIDLHTTLPVVIHSTMAVDQVMEHVLHSHVHEFQSNDNAPNGGIQCSFGSHPSSIYYYG